MSLNMSTFFYSRSSDSKRSGRVVWRGETRQCCCSNQQTADAPTFVPPRSPLSALRSPLSAFRFPLMFSAFRSPLPALRSPLSAFRSPLSAFRSPLPALSLIPQRPDRIEARRPKRGVNAKEKPHPGGNRGCKNE